MKQTPEDTKEEIEKICRDPDLCKNHERILTYLINGQKSIREIKTSSGSKGDIAGVMRDLIHKKLIKKTGRNIFELNIKSG